MATTELFEDGPMPRLKSQRPKDVDPHTADPRMPLILDLDETLIHATEVPRNQAPDHVVFEKRGWRTAWASKTAR